MISNNKKETISADKFLHIHVVPGKNIELLGNIYSCSKKDMASTWRSCLSYQSKYKIITPEILLSNLGHKYDRLKQYLLTRYWSS